MTRTDIWHMGAIALAMGCLVAAFGCDPAPAQVTDDSKPEWRFSTTEYCRDADITARLFDLAENDGSLFEPLLMIAVDEGRCATGIAPVGIRPVEWVRHAIMGGFAYVLFRGIVEGEAEPVWCWAPLDAPPLPEHEPPAGARDPPGAPAREQGI